MASAYRDGLLSSASTSQSDSDDGRASSGGAASASGRTESVDFKAPSVWATTAKYAVSGGVAGAFSKSCTAPLARLTILYQVQGMTAAGVATMPAAPLVAVAGTAGGGAPCAVPLPQRQLRLGAALRRVARQEGVLSLWRGNGVTILHRLPYSSINFLTYEWASEYLQQHMPPEQDVGRRLAAGALAGLVACSAAYPLDLLRTRLAASTGTSGSVTAMLADIVRADGAAGLYRGLGATLLQVVPSLALNFSIYESARQWATGSERGGARPGALTSLACGCLAGFTTSTITFPLDVIRRRMQVASAGGGGAAAAATARVSYAGVIRGVMAQQGLSGFYAGIVPEYCKVLPGVAIAFCTYEQMKSWLHAD